MSLTFVKPTGVATRPVGADGTVPGVAVFDGLLAGPVPTLLVARAVNVYGTPFVSPLTMHESGPLVQVHVAPPGLAVTV